MLSFLLALFCYLYFYRHPKAGALRREKKIEELEEYAKKGLPIIDKDKLHSNETKDKMKQELFNLIESLRETK